MHNAQYPAWQVANQATKALSGGERLYYRTSAHLAILQTDLAYLLGMHALIGATVTSTDF